MFKTLLGILASLMIIIGVVKILGMPEPSHNDMRMEKIHCEK